jgi:hypothetical protein
MISNEVSDGLACNAAHHDPLSWCGGTVRISPRASLAFFLTCYLETANGT